VSPGLDELKAVRAAADRLADRATVAAAYDRLAAAIRRDFAGSNPLLLAVVVGGIIPTAELAQRLDFPLEMDYSTPPATAAPPSAAAWCGSVSPNRRASAAGMSW
jgi:Hypoxanthine-guanine phosphoribosyltransferase